MAREHNVTKILCHPGGENSPLCVYHPKLSAYACYYSDDENPPGPETLQIQAHNAMVNGLADFKWVPVVSVVGNPDEDVAVFGEYDENGRSI